MKILIDISAEDFEKVRWGKCAMSVMRKAILHGTPLPNYAKYKTVTKYPTFDEWKAARAESEE